MIKKNNEWPKSIIVWFLLLLAISSCQPDKLKVDVSEINVDSNISRLDQDILKIKDGNTLQEYNNLRNQYGSFFDIYVKYIIGIGDPDEPSSPERLSQFVSDPGIMDVMAETKKSFSDLGPLKGELEIALKHYTHYFPHKIVPKPIAFVSGLNYAVITTDSVLGIGLDMYLGPDFKAYESIGLPKYKINKMVAENIPVDCIKGMAQSEWEQDTVPREFLSQMIYQGKMYYFIKSLLPHISDEKIIQFNKSQLDWCGQNESMIWSFFIENNLLYSTDAIEFLKFINDGPSTNGFPAEAPPMLGAWVGWQIVKSFMKNSPEVSLSGLMEESDAQKILRVSKYKPSK